MNVLDNTKNGRNIVFYYYYYYYYFFFFFLGGGGGGGAFFSANIFMKTFKYTYLSVPHQSNIYFSADIVDTSQAT